VAVNVADGVRSYDLDIYLNGASAATVALASGNTSAQSVALAVAVVAGDIISAYMIKTAGAGTSTFEEIYAIVEETVDT